MNWKTLALTLLLVTSLAALPPSVNAEVVTGTYSAPSGTGAGTNSIGTISGGGVGGAILTASKMYDLVDVYAVDALPGGVGMTVCGGTVTTISGPAQAAGCSNASCTHGQYLFPGKGDTISVFIHTGTVTEDVETCVGSSGTLTAVFL